MAALAVPLSAAMAAWSVPGRAASPSPASGQDMSRIQAAVPPSGQAHLTLPAPGGPYQVGTVSLELIDRARANPWAASPPYRELMVSIWYPAADTWGYSLAPQMLPGAAAHFGSADGAAAQLYHVPPGKVDWAATPTSGHEGAPVARHRAPFPVVLYSPGLGEPRTWETTLVQDLVSRGYVVVTIDHTYEASEVEFPGGQVIDSQLAAWSAQAEHNGTVLQLLEKIVAVRVADVRSVLDDLTALDAGRNPGTGHRPLPQGLAGALDLHRIGMFGISAGGFTTAQAMYEDPRIIAGIDLDGTIEAPVPDYWAIAPVFQHGLSQPFMFMGDPKANHYTVPSWESFWTDTRGWHLDLTLLGARGENSYKDAVPLIPQIARQLGLPQSFVTGDIGTISPAAAVAAEAAYVLAFFDRWLRGHPSRLLDGPSPRYPQIIFIR
jgi:hypothetical protein